MSVKYISRKCIEVQVIHLRISSKYLLPPGCGGAWLRVAKKAASRASRAAPSPRSESRRTCSHKYIHKQRVEG